MVGNPLILKSKRLVNGIYQPLQVLLKIDLVQIIGRVKYLMYQYHRSDPGITAFEEKVDLRVIDLVGLQVQQA